MKKTVIAAVLAVSAIGSAHADQFAHDGEGAARCSANMMAVALMAKDDPALFNKFAKLHEIFKQYSEEKLGPAQAKSVQTTFMTRNFKALNSGTFNDKTSPGNEVWECTAWINGGKK